MDININFTGDPGTGNTFVMNESGVIYNNNPNATQVTNITNNYYSGDVPRQNAPLDDNDKKIRKSALLEYVAKLKPYAKAEWEKRYEQLWLKILDLPEVDKQIYNVGRQKGTTFNRQLVGRIIHFLKSKVLAEQNNTKLTLALEGKEGASVRLVLGKDPSEEIQNAIKKLMEEEYADD